METNKKKIVLEVEELYTKFTTDEGVVHAVNGISYSIREGEIVGIVGESGSGKSVSNLALLGLLATPPAKIYAKKLEFLGESLLTKEGFLDQKKLRKLRGNKISMIFQDPMTSLNPFLSIRTQMLEAVMFHRKISKEKAMDLAVEKLTLVGIADARERINYYPHEFSGGMRQRVMIAMALMCDPLLLIADEPTTALDVTIQAQIIELLQEINEKLQTTIIFITHDLGVIAGISERIMVMYGGSIVESGQTEDIFAHTSHPYTKGLLASIPKLDEDKDRLNTIEGSPPFLLKTLDFCPFYDRCEQRMDSCLEGIPPYIFTNVENEHKVACRLFDEQNGK